MEDLWLKIKFWTKLSIVALVTLYAVAFIAKNSDRQAQFWYWYKRDYAIPILILAASCFLAGIVVTLLVRTTYKTVRQVRKLRSAARADRLERELTDMKSKAAMLQTRPSTTPVQSDTQEKPGDDE